MGYFTISTGFRRKSWTLNNAAFGTSKRLPKKNISLTHTTLAPTPWTKTHTTRKNKKNTWNPRYFCLWRRHNVTWTTSPFLALEECQCFAYRLTTVTQASCDPSSTATGVALVELSLEGKIPKNFWSIIATSRNNLGPERRRAMPYFHQKSLDAGFNYFLCSPLFGEDSHFD